MGKAVIREHLEDGRYKVDIEYDMTSIQAQIQAMEDREADLEDQIAELETDGAEPPGVIFKPEEPKPDETAKETAAREARDEARKAELIPLWIEYYKAEKLACEKRRERLEKIPETLSTTVWAADYSLALEGEVGLVVIAQDDQLKLQDVSHVDGVEIHSAMIIHPDYAHEEDEAGEITAAAGASAYDDQRDGILQHPLGNTATAAVFNWLAFAGVQKYLPRHRIGEISAVNQDDNTANILLDNVTSRFRGHEVGWKAQGTNVLPNVPIRYMTCHAAAFEAGDRVIVEFLSRVWPINSGDVTDYEGPRVIGFEKEPQPCFYLAWDAFDLEGNFKGLVTFDPQSFEALSFIDADDFIASIPAFDERGDNDVEISPGLWVYQCRANQAEDLPRLPTNDFDCTGSKTRADPDEEIEPYIYICEQSEVETYRWHISARPRKGEEDWLLRIESPLLAWPELDQTIHRWAVDICWGMEACEYPLMESYIDRNQRAYSTGTQRSSLKAAVLFDGGEIVQAAYFARETVDSGVKTYSYTYSGNPFAYNAFDISESGSVSETTEDILVINGATISIVSSTSISFNFGENPYTCQAAHAGIAAHFYPKGDGYFFVGASKVYPSPDGDSAGELPFYRYWYLPNSEKLDVDDLDYADFTGAASGDYHVIPNVTDAEGGQLFGKGQFRYLVKRSL